METWAETVANTSSGEGCPAGGAQRWTLTSSARLVLESEMEGRASGAGAGTTVKRFLILLPREPRVVQMVAPTPVHDKTMIGNPVRSKYPHLDAEGNPVNDLDENTGPVQTGRGQKYIGYWRHVADSSAADILRRNSASEKRRACSCNSAGTTAGSMVSKRSMARSSCSSDGSS